MLKYIFSAILILISYSSYAINLDKNIIEKLEKYAIIEKYGSGKNNLYVFTNPYCIHCRTLEKTLKQLKDVTIYKVPIPGDMNGLYKINQIMCSNNKNKTWEDAIEDKEVQINKEEQCKNLTIDSMKLAKELNLKGTPTMYVRSGKSLIGNRPLTDIEQLLSTEK